MNTMSARADYIRKNYSLAHESGEWVARWGVRNEFRGTDRAEVVRLARTHWGHFNYSDEAVAFNLIFSRS